MLNVTARKGVALEIYQGERLQIVDQAGKQTAVMVAFKKDDHSEWLSPAHTREEARSIMLAMNSELVSNRRHPLLRLEEDQVGRHDLIMPACDGRRYLDHYGIPDHPSCQDNLTTALAEFNIPFDRLPDPVNFFMQTAILSKGELEVREPISQEGDFVVLRALTDLIVAVSACPQDRSAQNGHNPTDLLIRVFRD